MARTTRDDDAETSENTAKTSGPGSGTDTGEAGGTSGTSDTSPLGEQAPADRTPARATDHASQAAPYVPTRPRVRDALPFLLFRAAHPRQAVLTALGLTIAAACTGRESRELGLVLATVLVGQALLGWVNDLVDRRRDLHHHRAGKPVADGRLDPGTLWFSVAVAVFVVVPLSVAHGVDAGLAYLASLAIGLLGQWPRLRRGFLSWLPWAAAFALYPAFLSYGGWGGQHEGSPPQVAMIVLAAFLGVGVHLLTALWGLVPDNEDGWTYLPLRLGLKVGASKLLWIAVLWVAASLAALAYVGSSSGLAQ
jgi:hypothetical protein